MHTIHIRNLTIGAGRPKICIPIIQTTKEAIWEMAEQIAGQPGVADFVEWRADWFSQVKEETAVQEVLSGMRQILGETPILFTFRTAAEGGELAVSLEQYQDINLYAICSGMVDLVDLEFFQTESIRDTLLEAAQLHGIKVIASNHDFEKTPPKGEIISRLRRMQAFGADIAKIAVMPQCSADVKQLLDATWEVSRSQNSGPIITMSMGQEGCISRLAGQFFGSAVTFGAIGAGSAPGQINAADLKKVLEILQ